MKLGFTGTQSGMNVMQMERFLVAVPMLTEFHHGDCIGADAQAANLVQQHFPNVTIIGHPPINPCKRAFFESDISWEPKDYLVRNHEIVDEADLMIATPYEENEQRRSGTWATVRYARKIGKPIWIILPTGVVIK